MFLSESWLKEWVATSVDTEALSKALTLAGIEVEGVETLTLLGDKVVVGTVTEIHKHEDSKKLNVCRVDVGVADQLTIVCGAANAALGIKVPVALVGASLPNGMTIEDREVRGVASSGMLCAAAELGLEDKSEGLLLLAAHAPVGTSIDDYLCLNDKIIEVGLTPDRGDCLSLKGISREVSVLANTAVNAVQITEAAVTTDKQLAIELQAASACPRYVGRFISGADLGAQTPDWMREKLRRSGIRSIDPIVDVTNYVMIELGQPMHAFDADAIDQRIVVRQAKAGELLTLLDSSEIELDESYLVIADESKAVALAGIMGGLNSAITDKTQNIFLEAAHFHPDAIMGKARKLGMHTDASHRFERGVDFDMPRAACERATELLLSIVGGDAGPIVEAVAEADLPARAPIHLRHARIEKLLGMRVTAEQVVTNIQALGMQISSRDDEWAVVPPSWRFDITAEHDLIEEVGRTVGFDNVEPKMPQLRNRPEFPSESLLSERSYRHLCAHHGYSEAITYSFVDPKQQALFGFEAPALNVKNPIADNMAQMRLSLWPGLVAAAQYNVQRQQPNLHLFETGNIYVADATSDTGCKESLKLALLISGNAAPSTWSSVNRAADFYDLKADIEQLLLSTIPGDISFVSSQHSALHPGQCASIQLDGKSIGIMGRLHPSLNDELGFNTPVYVAELDLSELQTSKVPAFVALSKFPASSRDLALTVSKTVNASDILNEIGLAAGDQLKSVTLFDTYTGQGVDADAISLAFKLVFQSHTDSLAAAEVDDYVAAVLARIADKFDAKLRA